MKSSFTRLFISKVLAILYIAITLWNGVAYAKQPAVLGSAETVIGGKLMLVEKECTFHGLGTGYALYLTNTRNTTIGNGCAIANELSPELGTIMVQWNTSYVHAAESYQIDDFTWTARGHVVMASLLSARYEAKMRIQAKNESENKEKSANKSIVAAFNNPETKTADYLGVIETKKYPPTTLITAKMCSLMVEAPNLSTDNHRVMVLNSNGRTALGLSNSKDEVVCEGCALSNGDGSITVMWDYEHDRPERFTKKQVSWKPEGQEWIDTVTTKNN